MTNKIFIENIRKLLSGTFDGATYSDELPNNSQHKKVVYSKGGMAIDILLPEGKGSHKITVTRSQLFTSIEKQFVDTTISQLYELLGLSDDSLVQFIADKISTRVVARTLRTSAAEINLIAGVLETFETWSSETYEGSGISASFLIDFNTNQESTVNISEYIQHDFSKVLSNGFDSVVTINRMGNVVDYFNPDDGDNHENWKCPHRYADICRLTNDTNKIAFLLNRNGEILIFRSNELIFAKRRGAWTIFNHDTVITKLTFGNKRFEDEIRQSIYASALDVSFARCGGCIGYFHKSKLVKALDSKMINPTDIIRDTPSTKSRILSLVNPVFSLIDRRIRQEILGIDGATILDSSGNMIVAGAIIQYQSGSDGGGRSAAAKALSKYGMSLKISADGKITAYNNGQKKFSFA